MTFSPYELPTAPSGSRFFVAQTPAGHPSAPGKTLAHVAQNLAADRLDEAPPLNLTVRLTIGQVALVGSEYVVEQRGVVVASPVYEADRPGKIWKKMTGGELLDSFLLGQEAYALAPDAEVYKALREVAEIHALEGGELRRLNDTVSRLVCLRAGVKVDADALPHPAGLIRSADVE